VILRYSPRGEVEKKRIDGKHGRGSRRRDGGGIDNKVYRKGYERAEMGKHKTSVHWGKTSARSVPKGERGRTTIHLSEQNYFISKVTSPPGLNHCAKSLSKFRSP